MSTPALLQADNICRQAGNGSWLLNDVSLKVVAGDRWGITGATGAGKTLLLRALSLLDPIQAGRVLWKGNVISNSDVPRFRRQVVYLHQRPVLFEGTVETNLRLAELFPGGSESNFDRERVSAILSMLGRRDDFLAKSSDDLSGGEAQIVALMRVILLDPVVLLLDEPTAALDSRSVEMIEILVKSWLGEGGKQRATVWVSHDSNQLSRVAKKTVHLEAGKIQE